MQMFKMDVNVNTSAFLVDQHNNDQAEINKCKLMMQTKD